MGPKCRASYVKRSGFSNLSKKALELVVREVAW
jgi:hypothetical protein